MSSLVKIGDIKMMKNKNKIIQQLSRLNEQLQEIDDYCESVFTDKSFEYMDMIEIGKMSVHAMDMLAYAIKLIEEQ